MDCSTSTEKQTMEIALPDLNTCEICDQPAHGQHFGALTCRACAAFFRRCHFSKGSGPRCQYLKSDCKPDQRGRWNCKKCRLDRCISRGMKTNNIQYDRDLFRSSETYLKKRLLPSILSERIPATVESALGSPHYICFTKKYTEDDKPITYVDITAFSAKMYDLMLNGQTDHLRLKRLSDLEQLARGLEDYRSLQQRTALTESAFITKEIAVCAWEQNILAVANWLNYSETIRNLPIQLKMDLLQSTWMIWTKLERMAMTAEMRVNRQCGKNQFVVSHENLIDYSRTKADMSWWSRYHFDELQYLFDLRELFFDELVWEIIEIQPDPVELTYLLCSLSFGLAGSRLCEELQSFVEEFQEALANDLHNYFIKKNKTLYSHRIRQLMKIYDKFVKLRNLRSEKYSVCSILGVYKLNISNPEYFRVAA
ncbi:unnamed protein product [Caenorhabditis nigoni]